MIDLLKDLINIPSISGQEGEIGRYLVRFFQDSGFRVKRQPVTEESYNVLATTSERATILLCSHMDTVAPFIPYSQKDGTIYGRGACDAKGQIAAMFHALKKLREEGIPDVGLLVVVNEETNSAGAKKAAQLSVGSRYVVVGEPTDNKLAVGQKGLLAFKLEAVGTGGHSSRPDLGQSAIHKLLPILTSWLNSEWGENPLLGASSVNIGMFNGGVGINVLAPAATAEGVFRVSTSLAEIRDKVKASLPPDIKFEIQTESEPQHLVRLPGFETTVVGFGSDAAHLRPLGDIVLYGPGSINVAHRENEYVLIADLNRAVEDYVRIVKYLLEYNVK